MAQVPVHLRVQPILDRQTASSCSSGKRFKSIDMVWMRLT